jgi:UDP-N-acetyl-D-glucosamine dehydrogenase
MFLKSGLSLGTDFFLAFSPERVDPGNAKYGVRNITKLVGGCTPIDTALAKELYERVADKVVGVSSTRVAETAKLLENTFRSVNIALANEMAIVCKHLGVDVWEVIEAAATKPFGFMAHYPGPGIGGHCIPLDPHYLSWRVRLQGYEPRFISLASEINEGMPRYVTDLVVEGLNDLEKSVRGSTILILGVAYKPKVSDTRESPSLVILEDLGRRGAKVVYHDPYVPEVALGRQLMRSQDLSTALLRQVDCVVIATNHSVIDYEMVVRESRLVIDTRNATQAYRGRGNVRHI